MGYKHSYSMVDAFRHVRSAAAECADPRNDGFVAWGVKQDLYQLKWFLDEQLKMCPEFGDLEKDWLKDQEQQKILRYLKNE